MVAKKKKIHRVNRAKTVFLDAPMHSYKRVFPSISRLSVGWLVGRLVGQSVGPLSSNRN